MSVVPGPVSQDAVFKLAYASLALQCGKLTPRKLAPGKLAPWTTRLSVTRPKTFCPMNNLPHGELAPRIYILEKIGTMTENIWYKYNLHFPRTFCL